MLRRLKDLLFQKIRSHHLLNYYQDLKNYLINVEVKEGVAHLLGKNVLVLCPHPDDEAIGCGGTIKLLTLKGTQVDVLFFTDGESATGANIPSSQKMEMAQRREKESEKARDLLGVRSLYRLHAKDGELHRDYQLTKKLHEFFTRQTYDAVFCPWELDGHSDHRASFQAFKKVLQTMKTEPEIWFYETWSPLLANRSVIIDETFPDKVKAINAYQSQTQLIDYVSKVEGLAKYRSLLTPTHQFAEAFFVTDKKKFLTLSSPSSVLE